MWMWPEDGPPSTGAPPRVSVDYHLPLCCALLGWEVVIRLLINPCLALYVA